MIILCIIFFNFFIDLAQLMPQFDFFIISQLTAFYFSFSIFLSFLLIFFVVLAGWLEFQIKLFFKVDMVNRSSFHYTTIVFIYFDLLEQFVLLNLWLRIIFLCVFSLVCAFLAFVGTSTFVVCVDFVSSIIKDLNPAGAAHFGKGLINLCVIFIGVLLSNWVGILPFSFTITSSLAAPFFFSFSVMVLCIYNIIFKNRIFGLAGFLPAGTSIFIAPLIIIIEIVSNFAKFISLGIRLFANMFAGHLLLKVFYSIGFQLFMYASFFTFFSELLVILFVIFITSLEIMIAALQAFVMLLLTVLYIRESESFVSGH